jgi:hypothetical protein
VAYIPLMGGTYRWSWTRPTHVWIGAAKAEQLSQWVVRISIILVDLGLLPI